MILLVGLGPMAVYYAKVLQGMGEAFVAVGRGEAAAQEFARATGVRPATGGLQAWLEADHPQVTRAIVAVGVEALCDASCLLLEHGVRALLVEKPGGRTVAEIERLQAAAQRAGAAVYLAYNRRCHAAVQKVRELVAEDGGVTSFTFEITEWSGVIAPLHKAEGVKENWFLGNTTHVTDLAFFLGGAPVEMACFVGGTLPWHSRGARFHGAGRTATGALFSYSGDWEAPGRWGVEVMTRRRRFILRPLEELRVQLLNSVKVDVMALEGTLDHDYKPGLFLQVRRFLDGDVAGLCSLDEHCRNVAHYARIAGYA